MRTPTRRPSCGRPASGWDARRAARVVRTRLARRAVAVVRPQVWVVDDTGFPKDGTSSPGVARQYSGTLGKAGNCPIGVGAHAATDTASCPLSWRLFLPSNWDQPEAVGPSGPLTSLSEGNPPQASMGDSGRLWPVFQTLTTSMEGPHRSVRSSGSEVRTVAGWGAVRAMAAKAASMAYLWPLRWWVRRRAAAWSVISLVTS